MGFELRRVEQLDRVGVAASPRRAVGAFALPEAQAVPDALEERGRRSRDGAAARRQADALLAGLQAVQRGMLLGDEHAAVAALEALAAEPAAPAEGPLAALLQQIRLRARVTAVQCRERWRATPWRASNTSL
jgi:hypothetical protein